MKPNLAILSHEIGDLWRVLQAADESPGVVGPLPGLAGASPNPTDIQRLAEAVAGSASVAVVMSEMPPDSWIREACIQLERCGVQLRLVISKSALARDTSPTGDAWMVTTGSGMSAMPLGRNAPGTHLIGWLQASKSMYEQFVECARNEKGRDLGQLKISRGRLLAAVHGSLLSDIKAKTIAVGADGHAVEYSPSELDACLAGLRREVSERMVGVVPNDATVVVTDDAAAWMGPGICNGRAMRVLALRNVYERTRVILAACAPEPGSVLVVEDMIGQPRTLSWLPDSQTIEGLPNKRGWPRAAVIAVASLGLAWVATGATAIWYRARLSHAEAELRAKINEQAAPQAPGADPPALPASPGPGRSDAGPSTDFVDTATGVRFLLVSQIDLSLPDGRRLRVDAPFWAATTEVTVEQFAAFAKADPTFKTDAEAAGHSRTWRAALDARQLDLPVVYVTPKDAEAFARWMSKRTGRTVKVPDATRWELAARAGATTKYAFGDKLTSDTGAVVRPASLSAVSSGKSNGAGLVGVHGNAAELGQLPSGKWVRLGGDFGRSPSEAAFGDPQHASEADNRHGDGSTGFRPIILGSGS